MVVAWQQDRPDLDADDARAYTENALEHLGFGKVVVAPRVAATVYNPQSGGEPIRVWQTAATVEGGRVQLLVQRDAGVAVFVEDRTSDGTEQLLTDEQFRELAEYEHDSPLDDHIRRNVIASIAGVLVVAVAASAIVLDAMRPGSLE